MKMFILTSIFGLFVMQSCGSKDSCDKSGDNCDRVCANNTAKACESKAVSGNGSASAESNALSETDTELLAEYLDVDQNSAEVQGLENSNALNLTDNTDGDDEDSTSGAESTEESEMDEGEQNYFTIDSQCEEQQNGDFTNALVDYDIEGMKTFDITYNSEAYRAEVLNKGTAQLIWSKNDSHIACMSGGKHAAVPVLDMEGVNLELTYSRSSERTYNGEQEYSDLYEDSGLITVSWDSVIRLGDKIVVAKTNSIDSVFSFESSLTDNKASGAVKSAEDFSVEVLHRGKFPWGVVERKIVGGTILIENDNTGGFLTLRYDNVRFIKRCIPESGMVDGSIVKNDGSSRTFTIQFDGKAPFTAIYENGDEQEFMPHNCLRKYYN